MAVEGLLWEYSTRKRARTVPGRLRAVGGPAAGTGSCFCSVLRGSCLRCRPGALFHKYLIRD